MRTLRNIVTLMFKEFRSLLTDPVLLVLIGFMFTGEIISSAQISTDVKNATVGIIDQDRSTLSLRIRDVILPPYFRTPIDVKREDADELMDKNSLIFVLEIPPNFERDVQAGRSPSVQLLTDATMMTQAGLGSSYLTQIINREIQEFVGTPSMPVVSPVMNIQFNPNGDSVWFLPIMQEGNNAALLILILVGAAVIRERERGTIEHLLVMPVNSFELMMSKILANSLVILVVELLSVRLIVHHMLDVPINGSIVLYAAGLWLFLFCVASLGVMLATVAPSMAQFGLLIIPIHMVTLLFSGSTSARSNMPEAAQMISEYWPQTQFANFSQNVVFRGAGLDIVWPQMLALMLLGLAFLGYALLRFRKMLEQRG
ncbi:ABC transporter permease subunit [Neisseria brasiliensis]|uniref:ABC transporter permease n=1 Tax=Neisseria TaxID=482 RepID=UPI000C27FFBA|nr:MULTISPECIES: ABC transporter permease [Neisseria]PJO78851.1 hypothetical protein CWC45_03080 [Neisseria sp. N177_16]QGL26518.1 ABC transporter permease subunit [Neisseria brasiliensis]